MIWLIIGGYLVCGLISGRICATIADNQNEADEGVVCAALGGFCFWPLATVVGLAFVLVKALTWNLPKERREHRRERLRHQEQEAEQRMRKIRRMERELGIGDHK